MLKRAATRRVARGARGWIIALGGLANVAAAPLEGTALQKALEGVWCNSTDGGKTCWAYDEFFPDGRFEACGRHDDERQPFRGTGRVTIEGRRMCYMVLTASAGFWLQPGQRYCTEILDIDARTHRYRDIDTGQQFVLLRRPAADKRCP